MDLAALESRLGCPVVGTAARSGRGLDALRRALEEAPRPMHMVRLCRPWAPDFWKKWSRLKATRGR